tara:strand:+ start:620 stop:1537 length:918 start_codon:yes stop_codon:yes gene_type:complete
MTIDTIETNDLMTKTIAISVEFTSMGSHRKASLDGVEVAADADEKRVGVHTKILKCPEMDAIHKLFQKLRTSLIDAKQGLVLPSLFKRGVYLVPIASVDQVNTLLTEARSSLDAMVNALIEVYDLRIQEDSVALGTRFRASHYPLIADLREAFSVSWSFLSLAVDSQLESISSEIFAAQKKLSKEKEAAACEEIILVLRGAAYSLVATMDEMLSGFDKNGKPMRFYDSKITNLLNFMNNFEVRNVMQDKELSDALGEMRGLLSGVSPEALRTSDGLRLAVSEQTGKIKDKLSGLMTSAKRKIELE